MYFVTIKNNRTQEARECQINLEWSETVTDDYVKRFWSTWTDHNLCIEFLTADQEKNSYQWHENAFHDHAKKESTTEAKHFAPLSVRIPSQQDRVISL